MDELLPHPSQAVLHPFSPHLPAEAETLDRNADLNNVETGNNSEHVPVAAVMPQPKRTVLVNRLNIKQDMIDLFEIH